MFKKSMLASLMTLGLASVAIAHDSPFTDAQIAHIAYTAGQIDIAAAEQALAKSNNPDVIEFAKPNGAGP